MQIEILNEKLRKFEEMSIITRDSDLQKEACKEINLFLEELSLSKIKAIEGAREDIANLLLGFQCATNCILSEIKMWLSLKAGDPDLAWGYLIDAQDFALDSTRAHFGFAHNQEKFRYLEQIEKLIFPPQVFLSAGLIVKSQECSICGCEYGECDHLLGRPYMGEFCLIIHKDFSPDHIAMVDVPADKRCRVTDFDVENGSRNKMTWKVNPKKINEKSLGNKNDEKTRDFNCEGVFITKSTSPKL